MPGMVVNSSIANAWETGRRINSWRPARHEWLTPTMLDNGETEMGKTAGQGQPRQVVYET
jgi:hypothetical protein